MSTVTSSTSSPTQSNCDAAITLCLVSFRMGYNGVNAKGFADADCYKAGWERRQIDDATHYIRTFGRGRIVADQKLGPWFQIDHDRAHTAKLDEAARYLESIGLAERHPTKGNPRNVRFIDKYATDR